MQKWVSSSGSSVLPLCSHPSLARCKSLRKVLPSCWVLMVLPWRRQNNWRTKRQSLREWVLWSHFFSQAFLFAGIYLKFCFSIPVLIFQIPKLRHQETGKTGAFGQSRHVVAWMQTNITFVCQRFSVLRFVFGKHRQSQLCHSKGSNRPPVGLCMFIPRNTIWPWQLTKRQSRPWGRHPWTQSMELYSWALETLREAER